MTPSRSRARVRALGLARALGVLRALTTSGPARRGRQPHADRYGHGDPLADALSDQHPGRDVHTLPVAHGDAPPGARALRDLGPDHHRHRRGRL